MIGDETWVDQTTYYSILGLTTDASEVEIKKAYRKIAIAVHPDKNKSSGAADAFKLVSHAQSVLADKQKRQDYNRKLISKGLHTYVPKACKLSAMVATVTATATTAANGGNAEHNLRTPRSSPQRSAPRSSSSKTAHTTATRSPERPHTSFSRRSKPYEQQPYGFGLEPEPIPKSPHSANLPTRRKNNTFKAKSYQHQRPEAASTEGSKLRGSTYSSRFSTTSQDLKNRDQSAQDLPENSASEGKRTKLSSDLNRGESPFSSPFLNQHERHYARTTHYEREQQRRSTSPVKNQPNTSADALQDIKNLLKKFDNVQMKNDLQENTTEAGVKTHSATNASRVTHGDATSVGEKLEHESIYPLEMHSKANPLKRPVQIKTQMGAPDPNNASDIRLDELETVLPNEEELFDMQEVSDTLEGVRVKRLKTERNSTLEQGLAHGRRHSSESARGPIFESLSRPVNEPLPRIYKAEPLSFQELGIDTSITDLPLPTEPVLHYNAITKNRDIARMTQMVRIFQKQANELKRRLLEVLLRRTTADDLFQDRLTRVENTVILLHAKSYDMKVTEKLQELQNRQRVVAESFDKIMNSLYRNGWKGR
ncbi:LAME_0G04456g1_1 [Lachancea meyersii CBS 8951]|uniref:LAME_0G04456g1_1 n=1 Tax=Lachancea meyersii CBS 8951 TaxID=1266667 RepID=A0A1G4K6W9_9SACH|nr:LAME_0G04456g1_1 [Lachancea meyersii CBS 8951]